MWRLIPISVIASDLKQSYPSPLDGMLVHHNPSHSPLPKHFIGFPRQITVTHLNSWVEIAPRKKSVLSRNIAQCYNSKEEMGGTQLLSRRSVDPLQDIALGHWHPDTWVSTIRECFCAPEIFILSVEECSILFYILLVIVPTTKCSDMDRNC